MNIEWHYDNKCDWSGDKSVIYYDPGSDIALNLQPSFEAFIHTTDIDDLPTCITPYKFYLSQCVAKHNDEPEFYCYIDDSYVNDPDDDLFDQGYYIDELHSELLYYIERNNLMKTSREVIKVYKHIEQVQEEEIF